MRRLLAVLGVTLGLFIPALLASPPAGQHAAPAHAHAVPTVVATAR